MQSNDKNLLNKLFEIVYIAEIKETTEIKKEILSQKLILTEFNILASHSKTTFFPTNLKKLIIFRVCWLTLGCPGQQ